MVSAPRFSRQPLTRSSVRCPPQGTQPDTASGSAAAFKNLPQFAAGCSVGGCITTLTAHRNPELFRGVILLAPMLSLERVAKTGLNPYLRPLTNIADYLVPTACLAATAENTVMPELQARYRDG